MTWTVEQSNLISINSANQLSPTVGNTNVSLSFTIYDWKFAYKLKWLSGIFLFFFFISANWFELWWLSSLESVSLCRVDRKLIWKMTINVLQEEVFLFNEFKIIVEIIELSKTLVGWFIEWCNMSLNLFIRFWFHYNVKNCAMFWQTIFDDVIVTIIRPKCRLEMYAKQEKEEVYFSSFHHLSFLERDFRKDFAWVLSATLFLKQNLRRSR